MARSKKTATKTVVEDSDESEEEQKEIEEEEEEEEEESDDDKPLIEIRKKRKKPTPGKPKPTPGSNIKKPTVKKPTVKKPTVKKPTVKKPTIKKTPDKPKDKDVSETEADPSGSESEEEDQANIKRPKMGIFAPDFTPEQAVWHGHVVLEAQTPGRCNQRVTMGYYVFHSYKGSPKGKVTLRNVHNRFGHWTTFLKKQDALNAAQAIRGAGGVELWTHEFWLVNYVDKSPYAGNLDQMVTDLERQIREHRGHPLNNKIHDRQYTSDVSIWRKENLDEQLKELNKKIMTHTEALRARKKELNDVCNFGGKMPRLVPACELACMKCVHEDLGCDRTPKTPWLDQPLAVDPERTWSLVYIALINEGKFGGMIGLSPAGPYLDYWENECGDSRYWLNQHPEQAKDNNKLLIWYDIWDAQPPPMLVTRIGGYHIQANPQGQFMVPIIIQRTPPSAEDPAPRHRTDPITRSFVYDTGASYMTCHESDIQAIDRDDGMMPSMVRVSLADGSTKILWGYMITVSMTDRHTVTNPTVVTLPVLKPKRALCVVVPNWAPRITGPKVFDHCYTAKAPNTMTHGNPQQAECDTAWAAGNPTAVGPRTVTHEPLLVYNKKGGVTSGVGLAKTGDYIR
ncbi:hypothetical protein EDC01DRAFT_667958 [Geopyxis carbonaria]|nr:hypothetical protein EDC01DRAFT_667958 [Geopyxis carbonaria]